MPDNKPPKPPKKYRAVVGITLKNGDRVEPGELYPGKPAEWLIKQDKVEVA